MYLFFGSGADPVSQLILLLFFLLLLGQLSPKKPKALSFQMRSAWKFVIFLCYNNYS